MKTVLITGVAGFQGEAVADALLGDNYQVKGLLTGKEDPTKLQQKGIEVVYGDFADPTSLQQAFKGVDYISLVFPLLFDADTLLSFAQNVIEAYRSSPVQRIVFNTSLPLGEVPGDYVAFESKRAIEKLFDQAGLPYISLRPTIYLDNLLAPWSIPLLVDQGLLAYPVASGQRVAWLSHYNLGRFTAAALEQPQLVGKKINIGGLELLTGEDIARQLSQHLGKPVRYVPLTPDDFQTQLTGTFGENAAREIANIYRLGSAHPELLQAVRLREEGLIQLPVSLQTLSQWAAQLTLNRSSSSSIREASVEEFFTGLYNGNDAARAQKLVEEQLAEDFTDFSPQFNLPPTKEGFAQYVGLINQAFTQQYQLKHLWRAEDKYVGIWHAKVKHTGELMGIAPTYREFDLEGITIYQLQNGKIKAHWEQFSLLTLLEHLGLVKRQ